MFLFIEKVQNFQKIIASNAKYYTIKPQNIITYKILRNKVFAVVNSNNLLQLCPIIYIRFFPLF